jgi:SNF2 family DNA or RNA helicase
MIGFSKGEVKVLVTKASICGWGMNWQNCNNMIFCGLSDSYEQFYQAVRRCWRFGQTKEVNVHIIISEKETAVLANIKRKQADADKMSENMVKHTSEIMKSEIFKTTRITLEYKANQEMRLPKWLVA